MFKPSKGLWFLALFTKLVRIQEGKIEEVVKPELPISTRSITETQPFFGTTYHTTTIEFAAIGLKELKEEMK